MPTNSSVAASTAETTQEIQESSLSTTQINSSYSSTEKKVRNAAVKVVTAMGHGSGSLIKYKDMILIITAHHVADGEIGQTYLIATESEQQLGILIYSDPLNDIALIYPTAEFNHAKPMKWRVKRDISAVGEAITYSGYPSWHSLLSFRGNIAGYEPLPDKGQQIILQTYGYFGSSGSVIYDSDGYMVGVLWGIDLQREGVHENIVWVSPMQNLNIKLALRPLCIGLADQPKACR
jgi:S1-C subfamily serine protease